MQKVVNQGIHYVIYIIYMTFDHTNLESNGGSKPQQSRNKMLNQTPVRQELLRIRKSVLCFALLVFASTHGFDYAEWQDLQYCMTVLKAATRGVIIRLASLFVGPGAVCLYIQLMVNTNMLCQT